MRAKTLRTRASWISLLIAAASVPAYGGVAGDGELVRPLYARPATTANGFLAEAFVEYFEGLALQEAVKLEGWTAGLDFTWPFRPNMQVRLLLPTRTEADGVLIDGTGDTEIEGWGGTFDFATLFFEHQIVGLEGGANRLSWYGGVGRRAGVLKTETVDKYNHEGVSLHAGVRYDRVLERGGMLFVDTEARFYERSDDLNPGDLIDDSFWMGNVTTAWLGSARGAFTPGLELIADLGDNHFAVSLVPELVLRTGRVLDLKLGVPVGLSSDAPDWGAQFRMTFTFR